MDPEARCEPHPSGADGAFVSLDAMLRAQAAARPAAPALACAGRELTFAQLDRRLSRVANACLGLGLGRGGKVALLLADPLAFCELYGGVVRAGGCAVPLSLGAQPAVLAAMLRDSGAELVAADGSARDVLSAEPDTAATLRGRIAVGFAAAGWSSYEELLAGAGDTHPGVQRAPQDEFNIIYSSGTTGVPKGIVHSDGMRAFQVARMHRLGLTAAATTLISTPLWSNTSLVALLPALSSGGRVVLLPKFDERVFLQLSEREQVTHAMIVPVQLRRLLAYPGFDGYDLRRYQAKLVTSAPLAVAHKREALARWPGNLVEIYGLTEGGCTTILDCRRHPDKLDSVGRPAAGVEIRLLDSSGRQAPVGAVGEIAGRAVSMMVGYHRRPDLTERITWRDAAGRRFYRTGDLGRLDEDGFLHLCGRLKDVIISGGVNIYAGDLERILRQHPAVAEAAVIGIPSERWDEAPLGLVVLQKGARIDAGSLLSWANERLGKTQRLAGVQLREQLPRSSLGKILKAELRAPYWPPDTSHGAAE